MASGGEKPYEVVDPPQDPFIYQKFASQNLRFRYSKKNFYPPGPGMMQTGIIPWGSEFEMSTDHAKIHQEESPVFLAMQRFYKNDQRPRTCDCAIKKSSYKLSSVCNDDTCKLRKAKIECSDHCVQRPCSNKRIRNMEFDLSVTIMPRELEGICLVTTDKIKAGTFLIEYVGIITAGQLQYIEDFAYPIQTFQGKDKNGIADICYHINCFKYGNESRFIKIKNESSNCEIQEWTVDDQVRMILVAKCDIDVDQVLSISYPTSGPYSNLQRMDENTRTARDQHNLNARTDYYKRHNEKKKITTTGQEIDEHFEVPQQQLLRKAENQKNLYKPYTCQFDANGKKYGDRDFTPCGATFKWTSCQMQDRKNWNSQALQFQQHCIEVHDNRFGCIYNQCGLVFDTEKDRSLHQLEKHEIKDPPTKPTSISNIFVPYFLQREFHGDDRKSKMPKNPGNKPGEPMKDQKFDDVLYYHEDNLGITNLPAKTKKEINLQLQDSIEMEAFRKLAVEPKDKTVQQTIEQKLVERKAKILEATHAYESMEKSKKENIEKETEIEKINLQNANRNERRIRRDLQND